MSGVEYKIKCANKSTIFDHLKECNDDFVPPLYQRVHLGRYANKIHRNSVTFEAWAKNRLVGLLAAYFNDSEDQIGFITSVSVTADYSGQGIASKLANSCITHAKQIHFKKLRLEVHKNNFTAIHLYRKVGFVELETKYDSLFMELDIPPV
ncbi:GNAT family N-acetyltransferase [Candidatus Uhrbacteria bacterium]|nr:GNAT family N-acetyltransferase [Candidatus Uhrbacteria bacterium]